MARITVLQGHPDPAAAHFCHALAEAYASGALAAGHEIRRIEIARLDFPLLRSQADFEQGTPPPAIAEAQAAIRWAEHLVILFPLWLGEMPALLKGFLEQALRPGFAFVYRKKGFPEKRLKGRSTRLIVTMGMPALLYRWFYFAHGLRNLERNILGFVGIGPVRETLIGGVGALSDARRQDWLRRMAELGRQAG